MKQLRDRVAVVTGAASGIGFALCDRFAAEGMRVVLADVEENALGAYWRAPVLELGRARGAVQSLISGDSVNSGV